MSFNVARVAAWVAGLDFGAVRVVDLDQIPATMQTSMLPLLLPDPSAPFIDNVSTEWQTFSPGHRVYTLNYTLHYVLFVAPVGEGTLVYQPFPMLVTTAMAAAVVFMESEHPDGAETVKMRDVPHFEVVLDAAGKGYHGAKFALDVFEICKQGA